MGKEIASGFALAAGAAVLWSFIGPFSKELLVLGVSPLETAFWRAFLGGICFAVHAAFFRKLRVPVRDAAIFFLFGGFGVGLLFGALQTSIQLSGAATAMVLMYTAPAWVAVFSCLFFKETLSGAKISALCIALIGVALVCLSGGSISSDYSMMGILCGLLSGIAYAAHFPFYAWWGKRYSIGTIYAYMQLGGAVFLLPFVSFDFAPLWGGDIWLSLLLMTFFTNYLAYLIFAASLKRITQIQSAIVGNIEPMLAALWSYLYYNENFTSAGWAGCALILVAVFLLTTKRE